MNQLTRRQALQSIGGVCTTLTLSAPLMAVLPVERTLQLGIIADLHGGLATDAEARLDAFVQWAGQDKLDAIVQLGDFAYPNAQHQVFPDKFNTCHEHCLHVIGNHEFDHGLNREDCVKRWGIPSAYYRQDVAGVRILVLDGNEPGSPTHRGGYPSYVGPEQLNWLEQELEDSTKPALIFSHQPLAGISAVDNAQEIQDRLAPYRNKILLCLNGHSHIDSLSQVQGINYLHINSASYYWVGGKKRMAYYADPLFSKLTFDPASNQITIQGRTTRWKSGDDPRKSDYFDRDGAPPETVVTPSIRHRTIKRKSNQKADLVTGLPPSEPGGNTLKVLSWNIWGKLNQDPKYTIDQVTARQRMIDVVRASQADVVAMVETYGSAAEIARQLEFHHYTPAADANLCIFSRHPLSDVGVLEGLSPFSFIAATVHLPDGPAVRIYDVWLTSSGRHLVEIKNPELSDAEFAAGDDVRHQMLQPFLAHPDVVQHLNNRDKIPVIVAGDFNCVSHLDHHRGTRDSQLNHDRILPIQVSKAMLKAGFHDTYRTAHPDVLSTTLGYTWTTGGDSFEYRPDEGFVPVEEHPRPEYRNPYARIDYIYATGSRLEVRTSRVIKNHASQPERSFPEFPSDHAAVLTEFVVHDR